MHIFTSGTTGLPKPAIIKHSRYFAAANGALYSSNLSSEDIALVCLPLYHSSGTIIGIGWALIGGLTVVLRKKFSASNFWKECCQFNCTTFVYVGEICRYLVNQPKSDLDQKHKVRIAFGNGLRANVWKEFKDRFNVKCVEFYGSTEGNCTLGIIFYLILIPKE